MARPHKSIPAKTYHIVYQGTQAEVQVNYLCPYCKEIANVSFSAPESAFQQLEDGAFFEPLSCDHCGKITDVRFWRSLKV